jgi:acyl carrier protein
MSHLESLREVMALVLGVAAETIGPNTAQADMPEWDSVAHLNLMLAVEDAFGVKLDLDEIARLTSVPALLGFLGAACRSR